jgi:hypothetical protein
MTEPDEPSEQPTPPTRERPLFLAPRATAGDGHGYRNRPLREPPLHEQLHPETIARIRDAANINDEPECVGPAILDGYAEAADFHRSIQHLHHVEQARQTRKLLSSEQRLIDAERRARQANVNLTREFLVARKMFDQAKRGGRREPAVALRKLETIEAKLDGVPRAA